MIEVSIDKDCDVDGVVVVVLSEAVYVDVIIGEVILTVVTA